MHSAQAKYTKTLLSWSRHLLLLLLLSVWPQEGQMKSAVTILVGHHIPMQVLCGHDTGTPMSLKCFPAESQHLDNLSAPFSRHGHGDADLESLRSDVILEEDSEAPHLLHPENQAQPQPEPHEAAAPSAKPIKQSEDNMLHSVEHGLGAPEEADEGARGFYHCVWM
jgi:hypothetical protein